MLVNHQIHHFHCRRRRHHRLRHQGVVESAVGLKMTYDLRLCHPRKARKVEIHHRRRRRHHHRRRRADRMMKAALEVAVTD